VMNVSIELYINTLSITYKLFMGVPSRTNAFDISKKLGLNMKVIQNAKAMIGQDEQEINEMIASLEKNSKRVDEQRIELDSLLREAQETHDELEKEYDKYHKNRKR